MFEEALPGLLRSNPKVPLQRAAVRVAGGLSPVLRTSFRKYDWQFGPGGIAAVMESVRRFGPVDIDRIDVPLLALVGTSEAKERQAQARHVYERVHTRRPESAIVEFAPESGADAHCQLNNLPLAFAHIFTWLERIGMVGLRPADDASLPAGVSEATAALPL
jgi:hypothetical protein